MLEEWPKRPPDHMVWPPQGVGARDLDLVGLQHLCATDTDLVVDSWKRPICTGAVSVPQIPQSSEV
eukprot:3824633-Amphidinium_carterae.1